MSLISWLLSGFFVPRYQHENVQAIAQGNEDRWRSLEKDLVKSIETNRLFAGKIEYLGRLLLDESFPSADVETDEFYIKLESQINQIRRARSETGFRLARLATNFLFVDVESPPYVSDAEYNQIEKSAHDLRAETLFYWQAIRKIGAIALRDGDYEATSVLIKQEEIDYILKAIAHLRSQASNLFEENALFKEREKNLVESLKLSQNEVCIVADKLTLLENTSRGVISNIQSSLGKI